MFAGAPRRAISVLAHTEQTQRPARNPPYQWGMQRCMLNRAANTNDPV